jgi:hypothetical protein
MYLQSLAGIIAQRRFKTIEVFNESTEEKATKSYKLYKLAMEPGMTSSKAIEVLYGAQSNAAGKSKLFANLVDRTVDRLENLLLLTDPSLYSDDVSYQKQVQSVRSLVTGLYLAQNGLSVGAVFHLRKGLQRADTIPAEWQGICVSALRYLAVYNSLYGSRSKSEEYASQLQQLLSAMQVEFELRSRHDILCATARRSTMQSEADRRQWLNIEQSCSKVLTEHQAPWFKVSIARIKTTALQATGQYERMLSELRSSPLPRVEVRLMSAVTSLELGLLDDAIKYATLARDEYKKGSANWLTCTDVAMRSHMLSGNVDQAALLASDIRRYPRLYDRDNELEAWIGMLEAYCQSYRQLRQQQPPRRGRPVQRYQHFKAQLRNSSTTRQVYISLSVWQLIDARAQQDGPLYEQTLNSMVRYVRRRQDLRNGSRFGVFVEFLFKHRFTSPTASELKNYMQALQEFGTKYSHGEIISYEILGRGLTGNP